MLQLLTEEEKPEPEPVRPKKLVLKNEFRETNFHCAK